MLKSRLLFKKITNLRSHYKTFWLVGMRNFQSTFNYLRDHLLVLKFTRLYLFISVNFRSLMPNRSSNHHEIFTNFFILSLFEYKIHLTYHSLVVARNFHTRVKFHLNVDFVPGWVLFGLLHVSTKRSLIRDYNEFTLRRVLPWGEILHVSYSLIQVYGWVGMPYYTQIKWGLQWGLLTYNQSRQSSPSFLRVNWIVITGTLECLTS